jgi:hypothetical protein
MSKVIKTNDGYMALLDAVYFAGQRIGSLSEEGLDLTGDEAQKLKVWSAQNRQAPVKTVQTRAATIELTAKMIELVPEACILVAGGSKNEETGGWDAPSDTIPIEGPVKVLCGTGQTLDIKRAGLSFGNLRGGLGGDKTLGLNFGLEIMIPADGSSPYSLYATKPFIEADPESLSFDKAGGSKPLDIEASGPFSVGKVPEGFSLEVSNGRVTVIASANDGGSQRTGTLTFTLKADSSKTVTVTLTQSA